MCRSFWGGYVEAGACYFYVRGPVPPTKNTSLVTAIGPSDLSLLKRSTATKFRYPKAISQAESKMSTIGQT